MGLEFTFKSIKILRIARVAVFIFSLIEFLLWAFQTTLFVINFSKINSFYYFILSLHSLHTVTWAALLLLASTGHGIAFDRFATGLSAVAFVMDILAAFALTISGLFDANPGQLDSPSGVGRNFDIIVLILTYTYVLVATVRLFLSFIVQEASSQQRHLVGKFMKSYLGSNFKGDQLRSMHKWVGRTKKGIRWLAPLQPITFVVGFVLFFIQKFFLGQGYFFLVLPLIPLSVLWLFAISAAGSEDVFPPDGMTDISEIVGVAFAHILTFVGALTLMIYAATQPSSIAGPPFIILWSGRIWVTSFVILNIAILLVLLVAILLALVVIQRYAHYELLKSREEILTELKRVWIKSLLLKNATNTYEEEEYRN